MKVLVQVLATLFTLGVAIAGLAEILGFRIGPLVGPQWTNVWQYGLAMLAGCLLIALEADDLVESAKLTIRLLSFPLLFWLAGSAFPGISAIWRTDWGFFTHVFATFAFVAVWVYLLYLNVRYLMVQAPPGYFTGGSAASDPIQPGDE